MISIVDTKPKSVESVRVSDFIPGELRPNANSLITLLEEYYKYLNSEGLPSYEIAAIKDINDVDKVSRKYFTQIHSLIGNSIPISRVIDQVELYKIIIRYYNTRGSEDSIHTFFRIFYNEAVEVFYPKDYLFDLSGGPGRSLLSDAFKLQDGYFWQNFSYQIRSDLDGIEWRDQYAKLVHPIGMILFSATIIDVFFKNEWNNFLEYDVDNLLKDLIPPYVLDNTSYGFHSPRFQPGYLKQLVFKYIFTYLIEPDLESFAYVNYRITKSADSLNSDYFDYLMFIDPSEVGAGWLDRIIEPDDMIRRYVNLSSFITITP